MIKLKIIKTNEYANYVLEDKDGKTYEVNINFMNMDKPKIGDYIYIQENVLKEDVSLNYGVIDKNEKMSEDELILLIQNGEKIYLQRFYG